MKIPDEKIQEIRDATDIVELISQYVTLKKSGKSHMGLCPFHNEKTPSFSVDQARGFYYCFGCSAGGNAITFVMEMEKVGFPEALRTLAEKAGIDLPRYDPDSAIQKESEALYLANQLAADFYTQCLYETDAGKKAFDYISKRGFQAETIGAFRVGYAPNRWDGLLQKARRESFPFENLLKAGLILPRKNETGYYDRFRGRLMFPVLNVSGRVVGFGGRTMEDRGPKYINSPETAVYQKSRLLYGLFQNKTGIRRENKALLVEGYTDVLRCFQEHLDYTVAASGTALTQDQAQLISRYTKNIVLVYDGDSAGFSAALRSVDLLISAGLGVTIAPLPKGTDPDTFLLKNDRETMLKIIDGARSFIDYRLNEMKKTGSLNTPDEKAGAARLLLETIARVRDPVKKNLLIKDTAEKLGVDEKVLLGQSKQRHEKNDGDPDQARNTSSRQLAEAGLLKLLLDSRDTWRQAIFKIIKPDAFQSTEIRDLVSLIFQRHQKNLPYSEKELMNQISDRSGMLRLLTEVLSTDSDSIISPEKYGLDCILYILLDSRHQRLQEIKEKIKIAQSKNMDVMGLNKEFNDLKLKKRMAEEQEKIALLWKKEVEK